MSILQSQLELQPGILRAEQSRHCPVLYPAPLWRDSDLGLRRTRPGLAMSEETTRKPLRCRLGLHHWSRDSAMFSSADICIYCQKPTRPQDAARLALERELWTESAKVVGNSFEDQRQYVGVHLTGIGLQRVPPRPN